MHLVDGCSVVSLLELSASVGTSMSVCRMRPFSTPERSGRSCSCSSWKSCQRRRHRQQVTHWQHLSSGGGEVAVCTVHTFCSSKRRRARIALLSFFQLNQTSIITKHQRCDVQFYVSYFWGANLQLPLVQPFSHLVVNNYASQQIRIDWN